MLEGSDPAAAELSGFAAVMPGVTASSVLVVAVVRRGQTIVPNGFTRLRRNDELSLVGSPESLAEVTMRIGF